jgi:hypothetical protein
MSDDNHFQGRHKKSDKAKEKAGRPSSRHVREYERRMEANKDKVAEPKGKGKEKATKK